MPYLSPESQQKSIEVHRSPLEGRQTFAITVLIFIFNLKENSVPGIMTKMKSSKLIQSVLIALCLMYNTLFV